MVAPPTLMGVVPGERGQRHRVPAPDEHGRRLEHEGRAHRGDDLREHALAAAAAGWPPRSKPTLMSGDDDHRADEAGPQRQTGVVEGDGHHAAEHHHLALGEVDDRGWR